MPQTKPMKPMGLKKFLDRVGFAYDLVTLAEGNAILVPKDGRFRTVAHRSAKYLMSRVEKTVRIKMQKSTIEKTIVCIDPAELHKAMRKAVENGVSPEIAGNKSKFVRHLISEYIGVENANA